MPSTEDEQTYLKKLVKTINQKAKEYYAEKKENIKNVNDILAFAIANNKKDYAIWEKTQAELEDEGWDQWQGNKPLKNEMDEFLTVDADLVILQDKVEYFKTVLYQLEQIIRSINRRGWDIKNAIEWQKFTNGMM